MAADVDSGTPAAGRGRFGFVGREREGRLLSRALEDPPAVVMVEGEAGVGKTRLVREATAALAARGGRVITGACHPLREPLPYGPVIDALRQTAPWLPPTAEISPEAGALAPLLPGLADRLPPPPAVEQPPAAVRHHLMRAMGALLEACGPVTLVIEDMHWVDEGTRELLLLLARDLPQHVSMVLTYRYEDLPADRPVLGAAYHRTPGIGGADVHLHPLTEADIHAMAAAALGSRASHILGRALLERSAGLPLVVEEDLITLSEHGHGAHLSEQVSDPVSELGRAGVPRGLREAIRARVAGLSARALAITEAAAVLAVPAEDVLIARVAGLDGEEEGVEALVEALGAAVLRETAPARYGFRHALAQQAVYEAIPGPRRHRLHHRAITSLRDLDNPPLVQIAHHTRAIGDRQAWLTQVEAAADQALAMGDQGTAAHLLHSLLAEPHLPGDLRTRAALALSRTAVFSADPSASIALLRQILADPQLPTPTRGEIRFGLGYMLGNEYDDPPAALRELERAVDEMGDQRPTTAARAMSTIAMRKCETGHHPASEVMAWLERAENTAQQGADATTRAWVEADNMSVLWRLGDARLWELADRLPRDGDDLGVLRQTARALCTAALAGLELGHDDRLDRLLDESEALARRAGDPMLEIWCEFTRQGLAWEAGTWGSLEATHAALAAQYPNHPVKTEDRLLLGLLAEARGQWQQAMDTYTGLRAEAGTEQETLCSVVAGIGRIQLAQDASQAAWTATASAIELLRTSGFWYRSADVVPVAVQAALATGRTDTAAQLATDFEHGIEGHDAPAAQARLHLCHGHLTNPTNPDSAREHFHRAQAAFQAIGRPYPAAQAAEHAARTLIPTNPRTAAEELTALADTYTRLGATGDAARCQHTLRDLGQTRPASPGRRGYGEHLSPREQQVADLLATGATNKDIAQALFLSPRTVEHHVAHVLKKLHITNRNDVHQALTTHNPN
ncbi:ATP-binding protein [Streptomyces sp.]|uniref:ATP-binding protein n=1 Tax=Streptomyces sp. TaxID=1931 RepID=UPI002D7753BE|nr:AAA family ATPase [Streptomyces sp.]HET6353592.1 AAA family ATPase [Streptomyces sp.]